MTQLQRTKKLENCLTRRAILRRIIFSNFFLIGLSVPKEWVQAGLLPTLEQTEGPFYPIEKPIDQDADLTFVSTRKKQAQGKIYIIQGRVMNIYGQPLPGALVEIWQANKWGRYQDRRDAANLPWDHNFQGYGKVKTDDFGYYAFKTIKPAGYRQGSIRRTPHIHFKVNKHGFDELVTQMYFANEPENEGDIFLSNAERKESVLVKFKLVEGGRRLGNFDLILG